MARAPRLAALVREMVHDSKVAGTQLVFSTIGGSLFVPRALRRRLYERGGAVMGSAPGSGFTFAGKAQNLSVGRDVFMNEGVFVEAVGPVQIGDGCMLGMEAMIVTSHHPVVDGRISPWGEGRPVTLEDRVWVGARAVILPDSYVESDVVIAAGAVVRGRCHARGVYAGVPARRIRDLAG